MNEFFSTPEQNKESEIDLTNLSIKFDSDENIKALILKSNSEENYEEWLEKNKKDLEEKQDKIRKAVEISVLENSNPKTIHDFVIKKSTKDLAKIIDIKNDLEQNLENILQKVEEKLKKFLPNWEITPTKIKFSIYKRADFRVDRDIIYIDLERLGHSDNPMEKVVRGITHEIFHVWMGEFNKWNDSEQNQVTDETFKNQIIFKAINEGLAVLISEQSLKNHHEKQGKKYFEYKKESLIKFQEFLEKNTYNHQFIKKISEEFKNMGRFYVAGYEIVKSVLEKEGLENFKKFMIKARKNPEIFLQKYGLV